jgi:hypothetical protein
MSSKVGTLGDASGRSEIRLTCLVMRRSSVRVRPQAPAQAPAQMVAGPAWGPLALQPVGRGSRSPERAEQPDRIYLIPGSIGSTALLVSSTRIISAGCDPMQIRGMLPVQES